MIEGCMRKYFTGWGKKLQTDKGMTLIEILVVVAIMSIVTGGVGVSLSLAYSRDSEKCAKTINAALENARMMAMSEQGNFDLTIDMQNNAMTITQVVKADDGTASETVIYNEDLQNRVRIYMVSEEGGESADTVTIRFDKSTGKVASVSSGENKIIRITSENSSGKKATVVLIKGTGKHYVEYK
jgi:prepilin-type N-terminal cleavage/methylation domain-containing protein